MALETIPYYNDLFNFAVYETLNMNGSQYGCNFGTMENVSEKPQNHDGGALLFSSELPPLQSLAQGRANRRANLGVQGRKKRKRRQKVCKNREEAETQRMTHIAVERNRRKQMNEHLAVLRSLMPESYAQRGDQASIVGGAIEFVKELEHLVNSLETQKLLFLQRADIISSRTTDTPTATTLLEPPLPEIFSIPQHTISQVGPVGNRYTLKSKAATAEIEVTLVETHANLRILSKKNPRQLSRLVLGFQTLLLTILHLNVTTLDLLVLYSINVKVEEGCQLTSVDSIAEAVHHMLKIMEEDVVL